MHDVSGSSGAAPIWAAIMGHLHQQQASPAPRPPAGVLATAVQFGPAPGQPNAPIEAARTEWFVAGTEQGRFAIDPSSPVVQSGQTFARISSPATGTIVALDPDIPPLHQRLHLRASVAGPAAQQLRWRLDEKVLGQGHYLTWLPWPGRHQITLTDARGTVLDSVRIEVRGAAVRTHATTAPQR